METMETRPGVNHPKIGISKNVHRGGGGDSKAQGVGDNHDHHGMSSKDKNLK
jgi:hypothetical protein